MIVEKAIEVLVEKIVGAAFPMLKDLFASDQHKIDFGIRLQQHLTEVSNWSRYIQFYEMFEPEDTDTSTVPIPLGIPRKFSAITKNKVSTQKIDALSLLADSYNYLILGDPGSGKTTTLKRLARYMLLEPPRSEYDQWQYPLVIKLAEIKENSSLIQSIANNIGLEYVLKEIETTEVKKDKDGNLIKDKSGKIELLKRHHTELYCGNELLTWAIPKVLNITQALVLLDGLDEARQASRPNLEQEIVSLALRLRDAKIIVTCRSGDFYNKQYDGFKILEMSPLRPEEIEEISKKWLKGDPSEFLGMLDKLPYKDLADRPLFLCQLLVLYKNTGYLPQKPTIVYKKITELLLERWDLQQHHILRRSKYAGFDPSQKHDFLAALSYHLTYKASLTYFTNDDLVDAYCSIHQLFGLPTEEALDVARELETHTGIIVEGGYGYFKFSHLSLQEYLCADYLVREPHAKYIFTYFCSYSAPIALMVALSADPSYRLAGLILDKNFDIVNIRSLSSFFSRLLLEKPNFREHPYLGFALLKLFFEKKDELVSSIIELFHLYDGIKKSLAHALEYYNLIYDQSTADSYWLEKRGFYGHESEKWPTPQEGFLKKSIVLELEMSSIVKSYENKTTSGLHGRFKWLRPSQY